MILSRRPNDDDSHDGFTKWPFMTTHTWAEYPQGIWFLEVFVFAILFYRRENYISLSLGEIQFSDSANRVFQRMDFDVARHKRTTVYRTGRFGSSFQIGHSQESSRGKEQNVLRTQRGILYLFSYFHF